MWECRPEHHGGGGAYRDAPVDELDGGLPRELLVGELRLGREHAQSQPLQQLAAAVGVAGVGLREVDVGVDESRQQKPWPVVVRGG